MVEKTFMSNMLNRYLKILCTAFFTKNIKIPYVEALSTEHFPIDLLTDNAAIKK